MTHSLTLSQKLTRLSFQSRIPLVTIAHWMLMLMSFQQLTLSSILHLRLLRPICLHQSLPRLTLQAQQPLRSRMCLRLSQD
jgi:hypothetical protein